MITTEENRHFASPGNPVAMIRTVSAVWGDVPEHRTAYKNVLTFCPGCRMLHPFTVEVYGDPPYSGRGLGTAEPVWTWDGDLVTPTFAPSMLCYYTVHMCAVLRPDYVHWEVCPDRSTCGNRGHGLENFDDELDLEDQQDTVIYTHYLPHVVDPAWGNCHSFLKNGVWQFLGDCAHKMANMEVPMVPLPDWCLK
jgi:hypothetical protein